MREDYDKIVPIMHTHAHSPTLHASFSHYGLLWPFMLVIFGPIYQTTCIVHVYIGYPSLIIKNDVNLTQWLLKLCIFKEGSIHFNGCGLAARIQF